jgi:magnesium transporter
VFVAGQVAGQGEERYFRDVYDHLIQISDLIDSYRDLLDERDGRLPLDGLESPQRVMKQLAVIAMIFCNSPHKIGVCWLGA